MQRSRSEALKSLPAVSRLLASRAVKPLLGRYGSGLVTELLREALEALRAEVRAGELAGAELRAAVGAGSIAGRVDRAARALLAPRPRPVINATGVVIHTNLGRSILSRDAAAGLAEMARGYVDLEYDLQAGRRGSRFDHLEPLMRRLFPGHEFLVVNNNAAAIMLCLRALGRNKEVLISRGELVEIGGSFRVPDILAASGAKLREVGTTNRTRLADYRSALSPRTGVILKVHTSNFKIVGFTEETTIASLAGLAGKSGLPLVVDWGSGDLVDLAPLGIRDELPANAVLAAGADLVTFSGDKLLGGPQAGFVVGRPDLVRKLRRDPLARVCRLDRLLVGALHQTLSAYVRGTELDEVPTLRMLSIPMAEIGRRASRVKRDVQRRTRKTGMLEVVDGTSHTGGGSSPTGQRATKLISVSWPSGDAGGLERRLRGGEPPIIGRLHEGKLLLDLRTVPPEQDAILAGRLAEAIEEERSV